MVGSGEGAGKVLTGRGTSSKTGHEDTRNHMIFAHVAFAMFEPLDPQV